MPSARVIRFREVEVRPAEGLALVEGEAVPLSVRELGLLAELAANAGHVVAREDLYARVWGRELRAGDRTVDVYVHRLRTKLEVTLPGRTFVHTHVGFGYRFASGRSRVFHSQDTAR